jgi:hypothetical protein
MRRSPDGEVPVRAQAYGAVRFGISTVEADLHDGAIEARAPVPGGDPVDARGVRCDATRRDLLRRQPCRGAASDRDLHHAGGCRVGPVNVLRVDGDARQYALAQPRDEGHGAPSDQTHRMTDPS